MVVIGIVMNAIECNYCQSLLSCVSVRLCAVFVRQEELIS